MSFKRVIYPFKIIYSRESRKKISRIIDSFQPDVIHFNNINYQITTSVIDEAVKRGIPTVWTIHDYQLVCPNHILYDYKNNEPCERCMGESYINCFKHKCLHNSWIKSLLAAAESYFNHKRNIYRKVDLLLCPSEFIRNKLIVKTVDKYKTMVFRNFRENIETRGLKKSNEKYILYFGRLSQEKGIETLLRACRLLPDIQFVIAGVGEYVDEIKSIPNIEYVGYLKGEALNELVYNAYYTLCPSECYDNCPLSVIESQNLGTPVIGSRIGGIPELVEDNKTGFLFEAGNELDLANTIRRVINDDELRNRLSGQCLQKETINIDEYSDRLIGIYNSVAGKQIEAYEKELINK